MVSASLLFRGSLLAALTHLIYLPPPAAAGFSDAPLQKHLAKIEALNRVDTDIGGGASGNDAGDDSFELLGDLRGLAVADLTPVGREIRQLLLGSGGSPESDLETGAVPPPGAPACALDPCCVWKHIADEMAALFRGSSGRCTRWARMAVRLGFHDAGTWSKSAGGGGADGSICLSDEYKEPENSGLEDLCLQMREWHDKWSRRMGFGASVGMADLVQVGASVGAVVCPLGPRMRTFVGRRDGAAPGDSARLPDVRAPADDLIRLFRDKTIGPHQLVALVGAHTTSQQRAVDPARAGDPQDSTPGVWDTLFYAETTMPDEDEVGVGDGDDAAGDRNATAPRVFRFASDVALAQHPTTSDEWSAFAENGAQVHWNRDFASAYIRLSLLGVDNINNMTECTRILPRAVREFSNPDQARLDVWLSSAANTSAAAVMADAVEEGDSLL